MSDAKEKASEWAVDYKPWSESLSPQEYARYGFEVGYNKAFLEQAEQIAALQAELERDAWVSVEDSRKPSKQTDVYICCADGTVTVGKYWHLTEKWLVADARVHTGIEVTHWKPITPPTGSKE